MKTLEWLAMLLTLSSMICIRFEYMLEGFIFGGLASVLWVIFGLRLKTYGLLALNAILLLIYISGIIDKV